VTVQERGARQRGSSRAGAGRFERRSALGLLALVVGAVPFLALLLLVRSAGPCSATWTTGVADGLNGWSLRTRPSSTRSRR
jgi:undecaprenyl-diphosphatase